MKSSSRVVSVENLVAPVAMAFALAASACGSSTNEAGFTDGGGSPPSDASQSGNDGSQPQGDDAGGGPIDTGTVTGVVTVPLTSCVPLVFAANVAIGAQTFQLIVDTGSTSLGVAGKGCADCGVTPLYEPGAGSADQKTTATSQFGSGSWSGEVFQDSVAFESDPSVPVNFVSITQQTGFFQAGSTCGGKPYQGLIGFDRAPAAVAGTNAFFDQFVAGKGVPDVFATQLCDNGGTLWLGGFDPTAVMSAPQYTPVTTDIDSTYYYTVNLASIAVGGTTVPIPNNPYDDTILDTGTSAFILGTAAYDALTAAIGKTSGFADVFGADAGPTLFSTANPGCAVLTQTKAQLDATLPPLTLTFGSNPGVTVEAPATESYLMPYPGMGWCNALVSQAQGQTFPIAAIMGSPVLRSSVVIFDRAQGRIGFAPHKPCAP